MARGSDPVKVQVWRVRLERFAASGMKPSEFCAAEELSNASFYAWLGVAKPRHKKEGVFQQVESAHCSAPAAR